MGKEEWLLYVVISLLIFVFCSFALRTLYGYIQNSRYGNSSGAQSSTATTRIIEISHGVLDRKIAEAWLDTFPLEFVEFLARVVWVHNKRKDEHDCSESTNNSIYEIVVHDQRWRYEGLTALLELLICKVFGEESRPILQCMNAISFLRLGEQLSQESITSLFFYVLHGDEKSDIVLSEHDMNATPHEGLATSQQVQETLCLLGILKRKGSVYLLSTLVAHEVQPVQGSNWVRLFSDNLHKSVLSGEGGASYNSECSLLYLPRFLIEKAHSYPKAAEVLLDENFLQLRLELLGSLEGTRRHIADCVQLLDWSAQGLAKNSISKNFIEQVAVKAARIATNGRALFELGQLLTSHNKKSTLALNLYLSALARQEQEYNACLLLVAKAFLNLAMQYLCYEKEDIYHEYLKVSRQFARELCLDNLISVCLVHKKYENSYDYPELHGETNTKGFLYRIERVQIRLQQFVKEHLASVSETYETLCNYPVDEGTIQKARLVLKTMAIINSIPQRDQGNTEKTWWEMILQMSKTENIQKRPQKHHTPLEMTPKEAENIPLLDEYALEETSRNGIIM